MEKTQERISTLDENGYMVACILHFKTMARLLLPTQQALRKCQKWVAPDQQRNKIIQDPIELNVCLQGEAQLRWVSGTFSLFLWLLGLQDGHTGSADAERGDPCRGLVFVTKDVGGVSCQVEQKNTGDLNDSQLTCFLRRWRVEKKEGHILLCLEDCEALPNAHRPESVPVFQYTLSPRLMKSRHLGRLSVESLQCFQCRECLYFNTHFELLSLSIGY